MAKASRRRVSACPPAANGLARKRLGVGGATELQQDEGALLGLDGSEQALRRQLIECRQRRLLVTALGRGPCGDQGRKLAKVAAASGGREPLVPPAPDAAA